MVIYFELEENWRPIPDTHYSVSDQGRVRNDNTGTVLKPFRIGSKDEQYYAVDLWPRKNVRVHRLVAEAFIPNPESKCQVNHKDGDHFNNKLSNLEWVTGSENCIHAYRVLNKKKLIGADNPCSKSIIRVEDGKRYESLAAAALDCGLSSHAHISAVLNGKRKRAGGFHWRYTEEVAS